MRQAEMLYLRLGRGGGNGGSFVPPISGFGPLPPLLPSSFFPAPFPAKASMEPPPQERRRRHAEEEKVANISCIDKQVRT